MPIYDVGYDLLINLVNCTIVVVVVILWMFVNIET